jgi:hypothetical protein
MTGATSKNLEEIRIRAISMKSKGLSSQSGVFCQRRVESGGFLVSRAFPRRPRIQPCRSVQRTNAGNGTFEDQCSSHHGQQPQWVGLVSAKERVSEDNQAWPCNTSESLIQASYIFFHFTLEFMDALNHRSAPFTPLQLTKTRERRQIQALRQEWTLKRHKCRAPGDRNRPLGFKLNRDAGHAFTFLRAAFARVGAALAMVCRMLAAFLAAAAANLGANPADFLGELRSARHERRSGETDFGAIAVERDAARHFFYVLFLQTGAGAMFTFDRAVVAGVDAALVFLVHMVLIPY